MLMEYKTNSIKKQTNKQTKTNKQKKKKTLLDVLMYNYHFFSKCNKLLLEKEMLY